MNAKTLYRDRLVAIAGGGTYNSRVKREVPPQNPCLEHGDAGRKCYEDAGVNVSDMRASPARTWSLL
jgi:hypothetical protein